MDTNLIACLTMIGTWFAGIATFLAVLVALFNASAWKNQLIVQEEQQWSAVLMQYISCLDKCPDIATSNERVRYSTELNNLERAYNLLLTQFSSLKIALMVSKVGTKKFETEYRDNFNDFMPFHYSYIHGEMEKHALFDALSELTKNLLKFD
ncbi:hypothetical protein [Xenorhabdus entomophaga]|uniref:hypothetical protein n=1 Tax=Xenorhabdus entomophaga TaxID=3136257 RepID=UPI0030F393CD